MRRRISATELLATGFLLSIVLPAPAALAAPYCLQTAAISPQCIYDDPGICQKDALRQGGACVANPDGQVVLQGTGAYCLAIAGGHAYCTFEDVNQCVRAAGREGGACIAAPPVAPTVAPKPPVQTQQTQPQAAG